MKEINIFCDLETKLSNENEFYKITDKIVMTDYRRGLPILKILCNPVTPPPLPPRIHIIYNYFISTNSNNGNTGQ